VGTVDSQPYYPLTVRQRQVLDAIKAHIAAKGYPPSIGNIATTCGIARSTVAYHLNTLEAAGRIERDPWVDRGIRVVEP
jgi:repressor LexA